MKPMRLLSLVAAVILTIICLMTTGCSTPEYALEVGGKKYTTGDYFAYVYNVLNTDMLTYYYLSYYGSSALTMPVAGNDSADITLEQYIKDKAVDEMIRQAVLETMLTENNIAWDKDDLATAVSNLGGLKKDTFLQYGFNNERYINMYKATNLNETSLFYGLYDKGGKREISEEDIRKYFEENYLSYKIIEISLVKSDKSEMNETETKAVEDRLKGYLEMFNAGDKNGEGFDKVYQKYMADEEALKTTTTTTTTGTGTNTTTTVATTTTTVPTTTTVATTLASGATTATTKPTTTTTTTKPSAARNDIVAEHADDEDLVKVIKEVAEGTAAIKTYKKGGSTKTMALIFRMDPEAERETKKEETTTTTTGAGATTTTAAITTTTVSGATGTTTTTTGTTTEKEPVSYYEGQHDYIIQYMKYDEFNKEVEERITAVKATMIRHEAALNAVDIAAMLNG